MKLIVYGANHQTLDVEKRERISFGDDEIRDVLGDLPGLPGIREAVILSTCNRTEFILVADELACIPKAVIDLLRRKKEIDVESWGDAFYYFEDGDASRHLFRVISSLDSMVLGEVEIIRQVKHAFTMASEAGSVSHVLDRLFHQAFKVGKQARSDTAISRGTVSVAVAAVDLIERRYKGLADSNGLVIGGGKMAAQTARRLRKKNIGELTIANRTRSNIEPLARELEADIRSIEDTREAIARADIVVTSLKYPDGYLVNASQLIEMDRSRGGHPVTIVDISVPRVVEKPKGTLSNISLFDIESLEAVRDENRRTREASVPEVESIIEKRAQRFDSWLREASILPDVIHLRKKVKAICDDELDKFRNKLTDPESETFEEFAKKLSERILQIPIGRLREAVHNDEENEQLANFRDLFALPTSEEHLDQSSGKNGKIGA